MQVASSGGRRLRHAALAARTFVLEAGHTVTRKELSAAAFAAEKALGLSAPQPCLASWSSAGANRTGSGCWSGRRTTT